LAKPVSRVMTRHPHVLTVQTRVGEAAAFLRKYRCDNMPVVNAYGRPIGLLDERDLLSEGLL
jgi:arabinose-5-phosphate isomerase